MNKIVFVHFGNYFPKYLLNSIKFIQERSKNSQIYILTNAKHHNIEHKEKLKIINVDTNKYNSLLYNLKIQYKDQVGVRNNFWFNSVLRLLVLLDWALEDKIESFIHLESDCILLLDDSFIQALQNHLKGIFAPIDRDGRVVPSVMLFSDITKIFNLKKNIIHQLNNASIWPNFFLSDQELLTNAFKENLLYELPSTKDDALKQGEISSNYIIFDPAFMGQYFFGSDPRHNWFFTIAKSRNSAESEGIIDNGEWRVFNNNLFFQDLEHKYMIANLHNYAKYGKIKSDLESHMWRKIILVANGKLPPFPHFRLEIFIFHLIDKLSSIFLKWAGRGSNPEPTD